MARGRTGKRGSAGRPGLPANMGSLAAMEARRTTGRKTQTITTVLGGTATVTVDLAQPLAGDYVAFASLSNVTVALLGIGVLTVQSVDPINASQVSVTLKSTSVLSSQSVTVCVGAWRIIT
jgi:hypothetical protein